MKPKGGMTLIIAVGGGKPPHHGHSNKHNKKGCEMIRLSMDSLVADLEGGEEVSPEVGDTVVLETVEGEVVGINDDGTAHVELVSSGGEPIEYVEAEAELDEEVAEAGAMDAMGEELLAAAAAEDEAGGL